MPVGLGSEIAWWCPTLDNASVGGGLSIDLSGNSRNASVSGWVTEGLNRYITSLSRSNFAIGNNYTWARWVYLINVGHNKTVNGFNDNANRVANCICGITNGSVYFQHGTTADQYNYLGDCFVGSNQWRHIACRIVNTSGSNFTSTIFLDGTPVSTINFTGTLRTTTQQYMTGPLFDAPVTQRLDDFRFYNRALSDAEVAALATRRGYQPTLPTGLGGEVLWICPSLDNAGNGTNVAWDLTGINNPGVLTNMDPATDWVADTSNGGVRALDFDGSNDYVSCGTSNNSLLVQSKAFSISAWIYLTSTTSDRTILTNAKITPNYDGMNFLSAAGKLRFDLGGDASPTFPLKRKETTSAVFSTGIWYHVAVTKPASAATSAISLYVNGVQPATIDAFNDTVADAVNNVNLQIAARDGANSLLQGQIDDVRIYNRVLTQSEITALASQRGYQLPKDSRRRRYAGAYGL